MVAYCPGCGARLDEAHDFIQPYTMAENRVFHLWCSGCGAVVDVVIVDRIMAYELEH